jgi:hypothetical protein
MLIISYRQDNRGPKLKAFKTRIRLAPNSQDGVADFNLIYE